MPARTIRWVFQWHRHRPMLEPLTVMLGYWAGPSDPTFIGRSYQYPTVVSQTIVQWNQVTDTTWADFSFDTGSIASNSDAVGKQIVVWFGDEDTGWPSAVLVVWRMGY